MVDTVVHGQANFSLDKESQDNIWSAPVTADACVRLQLAWCLTNCFSGIAKRQNWHTDTVISRCSLLANPGLFPRALRFHDGLSPSFFQTHRLPLR
jgi:hypothetical protein